MIYKDVLVPIPQRKRITKYGGHSKNYVYEILARKGANAEKDKTVCVGIAVDSEMMHPNEKYFDHHPEQLKMMPAPEKVVFDNQIFLGASVLLRASAKRTGLSETLDKHFPGYGEVIQTLLEYYMLERESAAQLYKYYLYNHYTSLNYIPSESALSRLLNEDISHDKIQSFLSDWMTKQISQRGDSHIEVDFDSTNFNVGSKRVSSAERGKPKDDEGLPQINVAYFLDRSTGLPVYYDVYYGSIIDMEHCKTALEKVKTVKKSASVSFIMDRGYFFKKNLDYMVEQEYAFLCMGRDGVRMDRLIEAHPIASITSSLNRVYGGIYGVKEIGKAFETDERNYYLYLYYNSTTVAEELPRLQDMVEYCAKAVIGKRDKHCGIRNTYGKLMHFTLDSHDVIIDAKPNYEYLDHYRDTCGYFWIVSTEDLTVEQALACYRHRDSVEKVFRGVKTDSDLNKYYAQSDSAFESKSFLAFLTAVLRADITSTLKPFFFQYSSETTQTVLKELEKVKAELIGKKYMLRCPLTARQKHILSFYEVDISCVSGYLDSLNTALQLADQ